MIQSYTFIMLRLALRKFADISKRVAIEQEGVKSRQEQESEIHEQESKNYIYDDKVGSEMGEFGFRIKGPEPTRYGDWERKGRVSDF